MRGQDNLVDFSPAAIAWRGGAGAGIDAPCPAGRNLVNLDFVYTPSSRHSSCKHDSALDFRSSVNYCAARISVRVRGRLNLVDFSPAAEPGDGAGAG